MNRPDIEIEAHESRSRAWMRQFHERTQIDFLVFSHPDDPDTQTIRFKGHSLDKNPHLPEWPEEDINRTRLILSTLWSTPPEEEYE